MNTVEIEQYNACMGAASAYGTVGSTGSGVTSACRNSGGNDNCRVAGRPLPPAGMWEKTSYCCNKSGRPEGLRYVFEQPFNFKPALNSLVLIFLILIFLTGCGGRTGEPALSPIPSSVPVEISANPPEDAQILAKQGKFDEALKLLNNALAKNPDDVSLYLALALINRQKGDMNAALAVCNNGLERKPENLQLLEEKAALLFETGKRQESAVINMKILTLFKTDPSISPDMASLAREQIAKALKENPQSPELKKSFDNAMSMIEEDLKKKPGDELLQKEKANMLRQAGRYEEAVGVYRNVKEDEKKNLFVPLDIGKTYLEAGEYGKAEAEFERTIKQYPDNFRSYRNYGLYWLERGTKAKGAEAVGYLDKSVKYYEKAFSLVTLPIDTSYLQFKVGEGKYHRWKVTGKEEDRKAALEAVEKYYKIAPDWTTTDIADHFMKELKK